MSPTPLAPATSTSQGIPTLGVDDVAAMLHVNPATVRNYVTSGRLAHHRVGKLIRFTEADVQAFITATRRPASQDVEAHVAALVAAAPPLSDEQRQRLAALLRPAPTGMQR